MAFKYKNRVQEVSTSGFGGLGDVQLNGVPASPAGRVTFVASVGSTHTCSFLIDDGAGNWEITEGTVTSGSPDTLSRTTVLDSSTGGSKVDFASGQKDIILLVAAENLIALDDNNHAGINTTSPDGTLHVFTGSAGSLTASSVADDLVVENNNSGGVSIQVPDDKDANLFFGSPTLGVHGVMRSTGDTGLMIIGTNHASGVLSFASGSLAERMRIDAVGNILLGGTVSPASAVTALVLFNGTAPSGNVTDGISLYSDNVSASAELKVRDEAGNTTTLSPHNFTLYTPAPDDPFPWSYFSRNAYLGIEINVDISGAIRALEALTLKTFIHTRTIPKADWATEKLAEAEAMREGVITKIVGAVTAEEGEDIETLRADARQQAEQNTAQAVAKSIPSWIADRL